jgi:hypothetical protein
MTEKAEQVSLSEAARQLETTPLKVLMMLKQGRLSGLEDASGAWSIDVGSLTALLALDPACRSDRPTGGGCGGCGGGCH